ncbi:uncharacterized protein CMU_011730 [Cryptosporidium muris RN66]|uniref:Dolichyldiphosphatase n=1 Tax=Cryptosporidium muris (strain RN66) TaxID=441375 RepID=B6AJ30_CRYMR|nr:uncharacterized protein CMU_011730 [Cryptosporidium muris RN66]EEA08221.1 hypothetical protein, conserved [Cryptosporidium muris RN66]|eukprot:XP_002142570.1 hypothetical protein [Cryptosporidium muris RN66]
MIVSNGSSTPKTPITDERLPSLRNIRQNRSGSIVTSNFTPTINNKVENDWDTTINTNKILEQYWKSSADLWHDLECGIIYPESIISNLGRSTVFTTNGISNQCNISYGIFSVSIHPIYTRKNILAIFYSFIPYIIGIALFGWAVLADNFIPAFGLIMMIFSSLINELFVKKIFRSPRPPNSTCISYGMPSSHCVASYSFLIWIILEHINATSLKSGFYFRTLIVFISGPVPWARWYVEDHTAIQCIWGCIGGLILGIFSFFLRSYLFASNSMF